MIVVADTSPLNYLVRLGHAEVLKEIYGRVLVPHAVLVEMRHMESPPEVRTWALAPPPWVEEIHAVWLDPTLPLELGAGEREPISVALKLNANFLLIDERLGREQAESRDIVVAGTLAILLKASLLGHFEFDEVLNRLVKLKFRASRAIQLLMLEQYEQTKRSRP